MDKLTSAINQMHRRSFYELIQQIIIALRKNNHSFEDILLALVEYTKSRSDWDEVTKHLESARLAVIQASQNLCKRSK